MTPKNFQQADGPGAGTGVKPLISILICTYNRAGSLCRMLDSLQKISAGPEIAWEVVVVDNNSSDNTHAVVEEFAKTPGFNVRYVFEPKQGLSHARNTGVATAKGEIIAFTDDDVRVSPGWLAELVSTFSEFDCMAVGGRSIPAWDGLSKPAWLVTEGPYKLGQGPLLEFDLGEEPKPTYVPPWGVNMAFRKSAFEKYGLFRTDLGVAGSGRLGGEDTEFGRRLIRAGEKVIYSPGAAVFHPVERARARRAYFLTWHFNYGRGCIRSEGWPGEAVLWFGVPRYLFRQLLTNAWYGLASFRRAKRFYFTAQTMRSLGEIVEARKLHNERRSVTRQ